MPDTAAQITQALDAVAAIDPDVRRWLAKVGYPEPRSRPRGYNTLLRALIGQQISVKAAAGIYAKLETVLGDLHDPARVIAATDDMLRSGGLSRQKVSYARALAEALVSGALDLDLLPALDDQAATLAISSIRGFGPWSAQMYLMFAERRPDVWAPDDLALQEGVRRIRGLPLRPKGRETLELVANWRPHRTVLALFCWHVYANSTPL